MTYILWALLGTIFVSSVAFLLLLFRLSLEDADFWLRPITAVVLFVTFVAGGAGLATGYFAGKKAEERILTLETGLVEARTKQADAELKLLNVQNRLAWRMFDEYKFREVLGGRAKGKAEILYKKDDEEAYLLAFEIWHSLAASGWAAEMPKPGREDRHPESNMPFSLREGGIVVSDAPSLVVSVSSRDELAARPYDKDTASDALMAAFNAAGFAPLHNVPHEGMRPLTGVIRIVVGSRL